MKPVRFLGNSLNRLREFPDDARQDAGYQIDRVQRGLQPSDFKPMNSVGQGVQEIRVWEQSGTFRVLYSARLPEAIYVLHAFHKKTLATPKGDLEIAKSRFAELMRGR